MSIEDLLEACAEEFQQEANCEPLGAMSHWAEEVRRILVAYRAERAEAERVAKAAGDLADSLSHDIEEARAERDKWKARYIRALDNYNRASDGYETRHSDLQREHEALRARVERASALISNACMDWNDPPSMKGTADWANRWTPELSRALRILVGKESV